jgi:Cu-processing system permease protein
MRVELALVWHEVLERTRDRWVWVISALFALLAGAVSLYGRARGLDTDVVVGPSLVTLTSLFVPLVALVLGHDAICGERERNTLGLLFSLPAHSTGILFAKFVGRLLALLLATGLGLGAAALFMPPGGSQMLLQLTLPTMALGAAFLSLGVFLSVVATRQTTAISLVVAVWFVLVFFYDMGILGALVASDGAISDQWVRGLVLANPGGLYRVHLIGSLIDSATASEDTFHIAAPSLAVQTTIWLAWILGPLLLSSVFLSMQKVRK